MFFVPLSYLIDQMWGDPPRPTHPVIMQGKLISFLDRKLNKSPYSPKVLKVLGSFTVLITVGLAYFFTWLLIFWATRLHIFIALGVALWLASTTLAQKGLELAALPIKSALEQGDLELARKLTGEIVGRDTTLLNEHELVRAAVETVAENTVDGVTSPLFYAFLGGAPLAMAYRATNTLDSMLGYKNDRYLHFGWAAARFDDLVNYIPARLTALILPLAVAICGLDWRKSREIIKRDAKKHLSPNSGLMEAGFAGGMGITLGGENHYGDQVSYRALLGEISRPLKSEQIEIAVRLMRVVSSLFLVLGFVASLLMEWV